MITLHVVIGLIVLYPSQQLAVCSDRMGAKCRHRLGSLVEQFLPAKVCVDRQVDLGS